MVSKEVHNMKVIEIAEKYKNAPETTEKNMKYIDDPDKTAGEEPYRIRLFST